MNRIIPLIGFGLGLITVGGFWTLYNDSLSYFDFLVINDAYYQLMALGWKVMPTIFILVGIFCLIAAGVSSSRTQQEGY